MLDFVRVSCKKKKDHFDVEPAFNVNLRTKDIMRRGGDFYAVWNAEEGLWSISEQDVTDQVDKIIDEYVKKRHEAHPDEILVPQYMRDGDSKMIDKFHSYIQNQMRDVWKPLDEKLVFSNQKAKKTDYISKKLPYPLEEGDISAYEELISTLYSQTERDKLEWAIGCIISGDSKKVQKFEVLYGDKGTGKSTVLNIIQQLFQIDEDNRFWAPFDAKNLGLSNSAFALESFKDNPLVSIQHDGNLSKIEDNTKLNSVVSHEMMEVNAKYSRLYKARFISFLFLGTNTPVKITDAKSGLLRRLIDVHPSGNKVPKRRYNELVGQIGFELGAIAYHCLSRYKEMGEDYYDDYIPQEMMAETNEFYNFIDHNYERLQTEDMITLNEAWALYKEYCEFAGARQMLYMAFRTELRNYFRDFDERKLIDGKPYRNLYSGFLSSKFSKSDSKATKGDGKETWLTLVEHKHGTTNFDKTFADALAQYSNEEGHPSRAWTTVKTRLSEIDPHKEHYVSLPKDARVFSIDFDKLGADGKKDLKENIKAASTWPKTYAEVSKSGGGLHLIYIYDGDDIDEISNMYDDNIEIKRVKDGASLRRRLTLCHDIPIAHISYGLPKKGKKVMVDWEGYKDEQHLANTLKKNITDNLEKKIHADTASSIDFIKKILDDAYATGMHYDVSELQPAVLQLAFKSTNQRENCVHDVAQMHFKSDDISLPAVKSKKDDDEKLMFFDCEIFRPDEATDNPGLFLICAKYDEAPRESTLALVNPSPRDVEDLFCHKLAGFNCKGYDNSMLWGRANRHLSNEGLYRLSQNIIVNHEKPFQEAKNLSEIDIYEMCTEKMSLKKWEYALEDDNVVHDEVNIPWDQPAPKELWPRIIEYCINDVCATEAVFHARYGDYIARKIQVDLVKLLHGDDVPACLNDSTNDLSKRIIFGNNRSPQGEFNYRDLSKPVGSNRYEEYLEKFGHDYHFRVFNAEGLPEYRDYIPGEVLPDGWSILPFFKGYTFENGISTYLHETIGEGGRVYSVKGYYEWVWDGDISSQHPHSMEAEVSLGPRYQKVMDEIVAARVAVKKKDFETAGKLLGGALKPYLNEESAADLAQALKIVVNSIYGLTKASFKNEFRDPRNVDNIVAKRGALFMTLLKQEVEKRGFMVCHIKTDSIKIPHADEKIKDFVIKFGREYGYDFETEAIFSKFAIFNDAAYIGWDVISKEWFTKADQFKAKKQPYLFKTLFSHEPYVFKDFCEVMSVSKGALYLDLNEDLGEEVDDKLEKERKKLEKLKEKGAAAQLIEAQETLVECLEEEAPTHHNYTFVGRVGQFTPVKPGAGGGKLYRYDNGKYSAASGSKGFRWLESSYVKKYKKEENIDKEYYRRKVDAAIDDISDMVDFDFFISDQQPKEVYGPTIKTAYVEDPLPDFMNIPEGSPEELPWNND